MSPRVPLLAWDPWKGLIRAGNRNPGANGALGAPLGPFFRKRFLAPVEVQSTALNHLQAAGRKSNSLDYT